MTKHQRTFSLLIGSVFLGGALAVIQGFDVNETVLPSVAETSEEILPPLDDKPDEAASLSGLRPGIRPPIRDNDHFQELLAAGKLTGFPKDAKDMAELAAAEKKRLEAVLENEEDSRSELKRLESCFAPNLFKMPSQAQLGQQKQVPPGIIKQLPLMVQASCLTMAQRIVAKFPKLRDSYEKEILAKAKPAAIKMARDQAPF